MLLQGNYKMISRILHRGASIDYVNKNGKSALHVCVEMKLEEQVSYLLWKGACQHILDLEELDCCDKAKANGLARDIPEFNNCSMSKKVIPQLPPGITVCYKWTNFYQNQMKIKNTNVWKEMMENKMLAKLKPTEAQY